MAANSNLATTEEYVDENELLLPPQINQRRVKRLQRAAFGVGHVMNDICAAIWFSYTLLFFQVVLDTPPVLAGVLLLVGQVADALATPIVGIYADKAGSRKTWHLFGTALVLFSFPLIFSPCPGCQDATPIPVKQSDSTNETNTGSWDNLNTEELWLRGLYYSAMIIIFQGGWAIVQISHLALIPDLTPLPFERAELTAIRYTASVCSSVLIYLVTWLVLHVTAGSSGTVGPGDAYKFRDIVLIGLLIGGMFSIIFQLSLKSPRIYSQIGKIPAMRESELREEIGTSLLLRMPILYKVSILYVASRLFLTLSLVYMPLYLVESLGEQAESLATVPLMSYLASFISSMAVKQITSHISSRTLYLVGEVMSILGCVWIGVGIGLFNQTGELYGIAILMGAGSSITMVSSLCYTANLIGTHTENGAFVYSIVTFADKLLNGIAVMVIGDLQCDSIKNCPNYYREVLAFACGGCAVVGLITLFTLRDASLENAYHSCYKENKLREITNSVS